MREGAKFSTELAGDPGRARQLLARNETIREVERVSCE
jgi:hypothetical protein